MKKLCPKTNFSSCLGILCAYFLANSLAFGESHVGMPISEHIGLSPGVSFEIPSARMIEDRASAPKETKADINFSKIYLDEIAEQLTEEAHHPSSSIEFSEEEDQSELHVRPQESRRQLSMSLQKEAQIQEIFKKQKSYLTRHFISAEEGTAIDMKALPVPPKPPPPPPPPPKKEPAFPDTIGMVYIPAQSYSDSRGFYVSAKPVTNREYLLFITATHYRSPLHWPGGKIPEGLESNPVVNVSYHDALTYAIWAGKRLPTEKERQQADQMLEFYYYGNKIINEWTSTSFYKNEERKAISHRAVFNPKSALKTRYKTVHTNFKSIIPMHMDEFNGRTGFRVILDAS